MFYPLLKGTLKNIRDRKLFIEELKFVVNTFEPAAIIIYESASDYIFIKYSEKGIKIIPFESDYSLSRKRIVRDFTMDLVKQKVHINIIAIVVNLVAKVKMFK